MYNKWKVISLYHMLKDCKEILYKKTEFSDYILRYVMEILFKEVCALSFMSHSISFFLQLNTQSLNRKKSDMQIRNATVWHPSFKNKMLAGSF